MVKWMRVWSEGHGQNLPVLVPDSAEERRGPEGGAAADVVLCKIPGEPVPMAYEEIVDLHHLADAMRE